jgi:hypothetical protein
MFKNIFNIIKTLVQIKIKVGVKYHDNLNNLVNNIDKAFPGQQNLFDGVLKDNITINTMVDKAALKLYLVGLDKRVDDFLNSIYTFMFYCYNVLENNNNGLINIDEKILNEYMVEVKTLCLLSIKAVDYKVFKSYN